MTTPPPHSQPRRTCLILLAILGAGGWILNASRPGAQVGGCRSECATPSTRREGPLRVISLNILHGFPRFENLQQRLDLIAGEIRRQDADIVCLQEAPWNPWLGNAAGYLARQTGMNYVYLRANGNRWAILFEEGEAILSRYPLTDAAFVELEPRAGFFEHRVALRATAATPRGDLAVFVTHLTHGDPQVNRSQGQSLAAFVSTSAIGPAIVAGDLNAAEDSPQIQALAAQWVDVYRAAHPTDAGFTCCLQDLTARSAQTLRKRIDYIFLVPGDGARIVSTSTILDEPAATESGWQWASDHVGLMALFEIDIARPGSITVPNEPLTSGP
jgi:endonuclease/exonuclease/phosphatase family metal-dependent hydrolase